MPHTLVAFHAHPDDEALLTSGTMARAAAQGHRVVLVLATDGALGLAASAFTSDGQLAQRRRVEAVQSARALGVARVAHLGYADSGLGGSGLGGSGLGGSRLGDSGLGDSGSTAQGRGAFAHADPEEAARALARILREEEAEVLLTYDANGGYGHPDHVMVHHVGASAAALVGTPRVLQATVPRDTICRGVRLAGLLCRFPPDFDPTSFERAYSPSSAITHRISVLAQIEAKRASMRAHASQATADGAADRTLAAFLRIPRPLFDLVFGREWFIDPAHPAGARVAHDIFEGL